MRGHALEQGAFQPLLPGHDKIGGIPGDRRSGASTSRPRTVQRRVLRGLAEPADQLAGQVLQPGQGHRAAVERGRPARLPEQRREHPGQLIDGHRSGIAVGGGGQLRYHRALAGITELAELDHARLQPVLQIVHRVGHVVRPVHDLGLQAGPSVRSPVPDPAERVGVVGVSAVLDLARAGQPGVLERGVQGGPAQVQARAGDLGLQAGEQPEALRVALEPAAAGRDLGQRGLAVVAERGMPQVMREAGRVHQVGIAAECRPELAPDLGAFQRVGQPGAREVTRAHLYYLRLGGQPAQRGAVQHAGAVPFEGTAPGAARALGRLGCPPRRRVAVVAGCHRPLPDVTGCRWPRWLPRRPRGRPPAGRRGRGTASRTRSRDRHCGRSAPTRGRRRARRRPRS